MFTRSFVCALALVSLGAVDVANAACSEVQGQSKSLPARTSGVAFANGNQLYSVASGWVYKYTTSGWQRYAPNGTPLAGVTSIAKGSADDLLWVSFNNNHIQGYNSSGLAYDFLGMTASSVAVSYYGDVWAIKVSDGTLYERSTTSTWIRMTDPDAVGFNVREGGGDKALWNPSTSKISIHVGQGPEWKPICKGSGATGTICLDIWANQYFGAGLNTVNHENMIVYVPTDTPNQLNSWTASYLHANGGSVTTLLTATQSIFYVVTPSNNVSGYYVTADNVLRKYQCS